jgi:hypothetical protein
MEKARAPQKPRPYKRSARGYARGGGIGALAEACRPIPEHPGGAEGYGYIREVRYQRRMPVMTEAAVSKRVRSEAVDVVQPE